MDLNPIHPPSPAKKWNAHFWLCSTSDDWLGWSMDSNPIHHPLQPKNWNALFELEPHLLLSSQKNEIWFLDCVQLLMISQAGQWTQTPSATPLQPIKWNAHFWIMFNFWWSARLVDGLKPHPPPLSSQKNEMLIFGLHSTSDDWPGWLMDSNPIHHPSPVKKVKWTTADVGKPHPPPLSSQKMKCSFLIMFNFWWLARLVNGLKPHPPPLSSQKNEMLIFGLCSTSDDLPGWLMDFKPHLPPLSSQKNDAHFRFLDYVQLLMISQAGQPAKKMKCWSWNAHFWLKPHPPPLQPKKWNASFLDYTQLLMIGQVEW